MFNNLSTLKVSCFNSHLGDKRQSAGPYKVNKLVLLNSGPWNDYTLGVKVKHSEAKST